MATCFSVSASDSARPRPESTWVRASTHEVAVEGRVVLAKDLLVELPDVRSEEGAGLHVGRHAVLVEIGDHLLEPEDHALRGGEHLEKRAE